MAEDPGLFPGLLTSAILVVGGVLALTLTRDHRENLRLQQSLFLYAFLLRFGASLVLYQFGLVNVLKDEDASGWVNGRVFQQMWLDQGFNFTHLPRLLLEGYNGNNLGYYYYTGVLFFVTGLPVRLVAAAVNCFFGALTVVLTYRIAETLFGRSVAVRTGWLACLFPSLIIWSAQTLKEPVVIFLETAVLYCCTQLIRRGFSGRHLAVTVLAIVCVFPFRFYAVYIGLMVLASALVTPLLGRQLRGDRARTTLWLLLVPVVILTYFALRNEARTEENSRKDNESQLSKSINSQLTYMENFRENASKEKSGVQMKVNLHSPPGFAYALLIGGLHLMLAPFPWQWAGGSLRMLLVVPELLLWWWIFFVGVLPGLRYSLQHRLRDVLPVLCFIVGLGLLYSLMFSNVGLIYRQRAQLLPYLLIFGSVGLQMRLLRKRQARSKGRPSPALATTR